jgi:hypothetical protein
VAVKNALLSTGGNKAAIEWDWEVTRSRDTARGMTYDEIFVDLNDGKIASWRDYFDFGDSVDAKP